MAFELNLQHSEGGDLMAQLIGSAARWGFAVFSLSLAAPMVLAADPVEPDPVVISDPVEREFESRLQELRVQQKTQTRKLQERKDLSPEQRLEKRRNLVAVHQKELHALEAEYQGRLSPEARSRWMERKATRQRKFDKLRRGSKDSTKTTASDHPKPRGK